MNWRDMLKKKAAKRIIALIIAGLLTWAFDVPQKVARQFAEPAAEIIVDEVVE